MCAKVCFCSYQLMLRQHTEGDHLKSICQLAFRASRVRCFLDFCTLPKAIDPIPWTSHSRLLHIQGQIRSAYQNIPCIKLGKRLEPVRKLSCARSNKLPYAQRDMQKLRVDAAWVWRHGMPVRQQQRIVHANMYADICAIICIHVATNRSNGLGLLKGVQSVAQGHAKVACLLRSRCP